MLKTSPIHVLSAIVTVATDSVWKLVQIGTLSSNSLFMLIGITFLLCTIAVFLVEHFLNKDPWKEAFAKLVVMGIIAGIPVLFVATSIGATLIGWAGLGALMNHEEQA